VIAMQPKLDLLSPDLVVRVLDEAFLLLRDHGVKVQSPEALSVNHAYIRVNGTVDPPTLPVQQIGNTYTLTGNIENYTFTIEKNGIVFDGNGFSLSIPSYDERGNNFQVKTHPALIEIINRTDIIVKNFTIYHCDVPLSVTYFTKIATANFMKGNELFLGKNNAKKALKYYDYCVKYLPYETASLMVRGLCKYKLGDKEGALSDWRRINAIGKYDMNEFIDNFSGEKGFAEMINTLGKN